MFTKTAIKALGLASLIFSQSAVASPPGPFGQLNRDAKAQHPSEKTETHPSVEQAKSGTAATTFRYLNSATARKLSILSCRLLLTLFSLPSYCFAINSI
jgi:hypothetical protein